MTQRSGTAQLFESIHGDIYLWRIGEITAEQALEAIDEWMGSVESGMPQRDDGSGSPEESGATKPSAAPSVGTGVPHLDRACELLWQAGHPAIAETLEREVKPLADFVHMVAAIRPKGDPKYFEFGGLVDRAQSVLRGRA